MIPGRNLLTEKIGKRKRKTLYKEICRLLQKGPNLVLECKKIKLVAFMTPVELVRFQVKINLMEIISNSIDNRNVKFLVSGNTPDEDVQLQSLRIQQIVLYFMFSGSWPADLQTQLDDCEEFNEKLRVLLS